jgi:tetratricopeptide (TPR) repeat protein
MVIPIGTSHPLGRTPWATIGVIIITFVSWWYDPMFDGGFIPVPLFQHGGFSHIFGNMLFLWIFGAYIEDQVGPVRFLVLYFMCELGTWLVYGALLGGDGLGASGAISGLMGLYLARFYHERIRTFYWIFLWPIRYDIPVKFLIPFMLTKDVVFGLMGAVEVTNTAYFAHVGGFLTGLLIAKFLRLDEEGRTEFFRHRAARYLTDKTTVKKAFPDLERALAENPNDHEANLLMARFYRSQRDKHEKIRFARKYYKRAIELYYGKARQPVEASLVFLEMIRECGDDRTIPEHIKYASILAASGDSANAAEILGMLLENPNLGSDMGKKALVHLVRYSSEAADESLLVRALGRLEELFPGTSEAKKAARSLARTRSEAFEVLPTAQDMVGKESKGFWTWLNDMMSYKVFWLWWAACFFFLAMATIIAFGDELGIGVLVLAMIAPTIVAALLVQLYVGGGSAVSGLLFGTGRRQTQLQAERGFNIAHYYDKGALAEKNHKWEEAVKYYKGVLAEDPAHMQARFNLARLYHKQLDRPGSAIAEYEALRDNAPEGHVFRREAEEAIEAIQSGKVDEGIKPLEFVES